MLSEYSIAMHSLATDIWDKRPTEGNRVLWIKSYINEYIFGGALEKIRKKEERKRLFHGMPVRVENIFFFYLFLINYFNLLSNDFYRLRKIEKC